jgi:hypothetical protein
MKDQGWNPRCEEPRWRNGSWIRWTVIGTGFLLVVACWWAVKYQRTEPSVSGPDAGVRSDRQRSTKDPKDQIRIGIRLATAQADWDRQWFKEALARCTLDDVRELLNHPADRPARLRDAGWLWDLDWHAAGEAYLLIFERYAELAFGEAVGIVDDSHWLNLDPGFRLALLRGGGRGNGAAVMEWIESKERLAQCANEQLVEDRRVEWFRAVVEGWEGSHPGEALEWITGRDGWIRVAMLIGFIDADREATDWLTIGQEFTSLLGDTPAGSEGERQRHVIEIALVRRWFEIDPDAAAGWAMELPSSRGKEILGQALDQWRTRTPTEAVRWLEGARGQIGMDDGAFLQWVGDPTSSGEVLVESAAALGDPAMRNEMGNFILDRYNRWQLAIGEISENPAFSDEVRARARARLAELIGE